MNWRCALLCSVLLHTLVVWSWAGWGLRKPAAVIEPATALVMLQAATKLAPQPVTKAQPKSIAPQKAAPRAVPAVITQTQKSNALAANKNADTASAPLAVPKAAAITNPAQGGATEGESTAAKTAVSGTEPRTEPLTPAQYRAAYLQNPKPEMPYLSKVKGESGVVGLRVKVSAKGEPLQVTVETSSGFPRLDQAALKTVKDAWRFVPAKKGDTPIESEVKFNIPFVLKDAE